MKKHHQKGFGAIEVLVVILVLLLIGGAVWFVLNNKKDSKDSSSDKQSTSQTSRSGSDAEQKDETASYLVIKEWGIKIPLSDELKGLGYRVKNDGGEYAAFTFDDLRGGTECGGDIAVASLTRHTEDDVDTVSGLKVKDMEGVVKIDGYYYQPHLPQGACSDDETIQNRISDARKPFIDAVTKATES